MRTERHLPSRRVLLLLGMLSACACSGPPANQTFVPAVPTMDGFPAVSDALEMHCGTLDCHGSLARNLRIYGIDGLRFNKGLAPGSGNTTPEEQKLTYQALIAIQPEVLGRIVTERGAHPERWIVLTKGRGTEQHKGGSRIRLGDDTDHCITSWLTGVVDAAACGLAIDVSPPGGPGF